MFKHIIMRKPNYDKFPSTKYEGEIIIGWEEIVEKLKSASAGSKNDCDHIGLFRFFGRYLITYFCNILNNMRCHAFTSDYMNL